MFLLLLLACGQAPSVAPAPPATPSPASIDVDDPETCAACHGAVVEEWNTSMHARAHHDRDPIYGGMRALRMKKEGDAIAGACANCHNPRSPDATDTPAALAGVSCATCHAAVAVGEGKGAKALTFDTQTLRGPHDLAAGASPVHGTGPSSPLLTDGTSICLACHDATSTPAGLAACTTGPEYAKGGSTASCTSCHMPTRGDHASHAFLGPHTAGDDGVAFLASAIELELTRSGDTLNISLHNTAGHAVPTGFPGRMWSIEVHGTDVDGKPWRAEPSPERMLRKVYVDEQGKPTPAPFASTLLHDTRLKPGERRALTMQLPKGVQGVEVSVQARLLPGALAKKLGVTGIEAEAREVLRRAL